jgi:GNAT superfamily N-acetyltransferase
VRCRVNTQATWCAVRIRFSIQLSFTGSCPSSANYGWLLTKCLWAAQGHRKAGLGRSLMVRAEDKGRALGCHAAWLDTSSPAAMAFYTQLGYTPFGQLANHAGQHPATHCRWFMQKAL